MDLSTLTKNIINDKYDSIQSFYIDCDRIWENAMDYNQSKTHPVHCYAKKLQSYMREQLWLYFESDCINYGIPKIQPLRRCTRFTRSVGVSFLYARIHTYVCIHMCVCMHAWHITFHVCLHTTK